MKKVDREALTRAIAMVRLQSRKRCKQIDAKLKGEPWEEVGRFAAYSCQCRNLKLRSWQYPPCWMGAMRSRTAIRRAMVCKARGNYAAV